jgi:hypothetical protein
VSASASSILEENRPRRPDTVSSDSLSGLRVMVNDDDVFNLDSSPVGEDNAHAFRQPSVPHIVGVAIPAPDVDFWFGNRLATYRTASNAVRPILVPSLGNATISIAGWSNLTQVGSFVGWALLFASNELLGPPLDCRITASNSWVSHAPVATADATVLSWSCDGPLEGFDEFSEPGWDCADAEPISAETIAATRKLLSLLPANLPAVGIAPAADGTVGLEWFDPSEHIHKIFVDVGPGDRFRCYRRLTNGETLHVSSKSITPDVARQLVSLFLLERSAG